MKSLRPCVVSNTQKTNAHLKLCFLISINMYNPNGTLRHLIYSTKWHLHKVLTVEFVEAFHHSVRTSTGMLYGLLITHYIAWYVARYIPQVSELYYDASSWSKLWGRRTSWSKLWGRRTCTNYKVITLVRGWKHILQAWYAPQGIALY